MTGGAGQAAAGGPAAIAVHNDGHVPGQRLMGRQRRRRGIPGHGRDRDELGLGVKGVAQQAGELVEEHGNLHRQMMWGLTYPPGNREQGTGNRNSRASVIVL